MTFAGCVLVVVVLYWAQAVLVPIALAVLVTFVLTPAVGWLAFDVVVQVLQPPSRHFSLAEWEPRPKTTV